MSLFNRIISLFKDPEKLFYEGQEITPKSPCEWVNLSTNAIRPGPKFGEIVKCVNYVHVRDGKWFIQVTGYSENYAEEWFAPVISDDKLEEMLNDIDELIIKTHGTF